MQGQGISGGGWRVVAASFSALLVGSGVINIFSSGMFLVPITAELGISRGDYTFGLLVNGVFTAIAVIIFGWLYDRYGVRKVILPGILLCALATYLYSTIGANLALMYTVFAFAGLVGGAQTPMGYTQVVNMWFDKERGLALGIATAGVGLGVTFAPLLIGKLMAAYGWRGAYQGLALAICLLAFLPALLFIREPAGPRTAGKPSTDHLPGMTAGEAYRTRRFWVLTFAFFAAVMAINGTITNVVPMLIDRGVPPPVAFGTLFYAGLAIVGGRMLAGWFLDRVWGSYVAALFFGLSIVGLVILSSGATGTPAIVGAALCGAGVGAEIDLMGYLMSRYFGLKAFGKIYGLMFVFFNIGTGLGPFLSGKTFDVYKSYNPILYVYMTVLAVVCLLLLSLGPYVYKPGEPEQA